MKKIFSLLLLLCTAFCGKAQTFNEYISEVERSNAAYLAERYSVEIAEAQAVAAKVFNDPELTADYSDNQDRTLMMGRSLELGLSYNVNLGNARRARIALANEETEYTKALLEDYFRNLRCEAIQAWADAWQARSLLMLRKSSSESMDVIASSDSLRCVTGEIGRTDARQSSIEARAMKGDLLQARADYANALTSLSLLAGGMKFTDISDEGVFSTITDHPVDELVVMAQNNRADLRAAYLSKTLSQKNLALVRALRSPDVGFNVGYSYNTEVRNEIAPAPLFRGVTVGVSIPLKFSSANKGEKVAAEKAVLQADAAYEAALQQIEAEVRMAYSSYQAALQASKNCSDEMLSDAASILESRKSAYAQGDSSLLDYLLAVRVYNDTAESCIGAKANLLSSWARLLAAVGEERL